MHLLKQIHVFVHVNTMCKIQCVYWGPQCPGSGGASTT